jgi:hypothetical protein
MCKPDPLLDNLLRPLLSAHPSGRVAGEVQE